jgi:hypothetical protein
MALSRSDGQAGDCHRAALYRNPIHRERGQHANCRHDKQCARRPVEADALGVHKYSRGHERTCPSRFRSLLSGLRGSGWTSDASQDSPSERAPAMLNGLRSRRGRSRPHRRLQMPATHPDARRIYICRALGSRRLRLRLGCIALDSASGRDRRSAQTRLTRCRRSHSTGSA